ncbi:3'(2'),5'-bisphosphate nucleotidase CysQ [Motilimonas sp. 1_MG-2023]|uniref:3'(2'),5'-bisphosphate nucleotidase CysQ n=1 Tax=Motilimonas TaxID=1914248 RepID=UPI0026E1287A|nr:3'(2'),5'-bisphosphate nucleotidase CysQ [Motilimonas sp. 1_MG-2023]MDO6527369.1 3'(2'),5'-bisphosphate nucleotidase CysQ [Motilimonas sp. 1_MG-2023]
MQPIDYLDSACQFAREAGAIIKQIYDSKDYEACTKGDDTPVTSADIAAHQYLVKAFHELTPEIPMLSEEAADIPLARRSNWSTYWLVDPLDGTQEFISRSGDFATIIALVHENKPVLGVIYAPIADVCYYAVSGHGAFKQVADQAPVAISSMQYDVQTKQLNVAVSKVQSLSKITNLLAPDYNYNMIPLGSSSLKSCLVAEGSADCYVRVGPTGEWDTAGAQCIVEEAGGKIQSLKLEALSYNERESLENPNFIVVGDNQLPWQRIIL